MGRHAQCAANRIILHCLQKGDHSNLTSSLAFVSNSQDLMHILYDQSDHHWSVAILAICLYLPSS
jgi:hypothetical protein